MADTNVNMRVLKSTNINSSTSVSTSINSSDNILYYDARAKPMFINTPCVYKQTWAQYWDIDGCPKAVLQKHPLFINKSRPIHFPNSQLPKRPQPRWASTIWEIGKWLQVHTSQFPNFPKDPSPDGPARFGKLGNWEMAGGTDFPISQKTPTHLAQHYLGNCEIGKSVEVCTSQFPKIPQPRWASTIWEIGKLGNGWRYRFPNFPKDPNPSGSALFGKLGNCEICRGMYFPISQFPKRPQPRWASTIWEIAKLGNL